ncbi:MAG: endoglucanase, partial [Cellulomonadaceae bacterium]|nr:endoglucanase [Cellulomonadaceae bacterium]
MLHSSAPQPQAGAAHHPRVGAFVHADRGRIVGPDGVPLRLRGMGLGNWLLPEGYMWLFGDDAAAPRQIEALVADLLGREDAERFWRTFRDRFISRHDVEQIALEGFDHVRLPINWRVLMTDDGASRPEGFALVDRLVG